MNNKMDDLKFNIDNYLVETKDKMFTQTNKQKRYDLLNRSIHKVNRMYKRKAITEKEKKHFNKEINEFYDNLIFNELLLQRGLF